MQTLALCGLIFTTTGWTLVAVFVAKGRHQCGGQRQDEPLSPESSGFHSSLSPSWLLINNSSLFISSVRLHCQLWMLCSSPLQPGTGACAVFSHIPPTSHISSPPAPRGNPTLSQTLKFSSFQRPHPAVIRVAFSFRNIIVFLVHKSNISGLFF